MDRLFAPCRLKDLNKMASLTHLPRFPVSQMEREISREWLSPPKLGAPLVKWAQGKQLQLQSLSFLGTWCNSGFWVLHHCFWEHSLTRNLIHTLCRESFYGLPYAWGLKQIDWDKFYMSLNSTLMNRLTSDLQLCHCQQKVAPWH